MNPLASFFRAQGLGDARGERRRARALAREPRELSRRGASRDARAARSSFRRFETPKRRSNPFVDSIAPPPCGNSETARSIKSIDASAPLVRRPPPLPAQVAAMEGGSPTIVTNAEGGRTTPSVVAYAKNGDRLVGQARLAAARDHAATSLFFRSVSEGAFFFRSLKPAVFSLAPLGVAPSLLPSPLTSLPSTPRPPRDLPRAPARRLFNRSRSARASLTPRTPSSPSSASSAAGGTKSARRRRRSRTRPRRARTATSSSSAPPRARTSPRRRSPRRCSASCATTPRPTLATR